MHCQHRILFTFNVHRTCAVWQILKAHRPIMNRLPAQSKQFYIPTMFARLLGLV